MNPSKETQELIDALKAFDEKEEMIGSFYGIEGMAHELAQKMARVKNGLALDCVWQVIPYTVDGTLEMLRDGDGKTAEKFILPAHTFVTGLLAAQDPEYFLEQAWMAQQGSGGSHDSWLTTHWAPRNKKR